MNDQKGFPVVNIVRENRVSKRTGSTYQVLVITFANGYKLDVFLNSEQQYILSDVPVV